jgi:MFS family permease
MSMYLYMPTLPTYIQSKTHDLALVGVVLSMYGLWQAIVRLPVGIGADWLNWQKPFIVVGLALAGVGAWMMGTANSVNALLIGRALTGLAAGIWAVLMVVFSNLFPSHKVVQASAALTLISSLGRVVGTSVTGTLNQVGGYWLAFLLAAVASALSVLLALVVPETRRPPQRPSLRGIGRLITRRPVWLPSALNAVGQYVIWAAPLGFVPILAQQLGATGTTQSLLLSLNLGMFVAGNLLATAVSGRVRSRHLVIMSFVLLFAGVGAIALAKALPALFVGETLLGASQGIGYPVLMGLSIEYVKSDERTRPWDCTRPCMLSACLAARGSAAISQRRRPPAYVRPHCRVPPPRLARRTVAGVRTSPSRRSPPRLVQGSVSPQAMPNHTATRRTPPNRRAATRRAEPHP